MSALPPSVLDQMRYIAIMGDAPMGHPCHDSPSEQEDKFSTASLARHLVLDVRAGSLLSAVPSAASIM